MKKCLPIIIFLFFCFNFLIAQNAWFNEIHYDNTGTDANEFIEVVIENAGDYSLSDFEVVLYNGNGGTVYGTTPLNQFTEGATVLNFTIYYFVYPTNGIQNGSPDGMALVYQGTLIPGQFLSYEGTFTATEGPANGVLSTDIGVSEAWTDPVGQSLQLLGSGTQYSDFTWSGPHAETSGSVNSDGTTDQSLPVELTSFTARAGDQQVTLRWATAAEVDNQGFAILRSASKTSGYSQIDSYLDNPALKGAGNSSEGHQYQFIDRAVINGMTYWYKLIDVDFNGHRTEHGPVFATPHAAEIAIDPLQGILPEAFALNQNYPNPFNPATKINFAIPVVKDGVVGVKIAVFDMLGQRIKTLLESPMVPGVYEIEWDGTNDLGQIVPSGVYIYNFESPLFSSSRKMVLMR